MYAFLNPLRYACLLALLLSSCIAPASSTNYFYAKSEVHAVNGLCIGCSTLNPTLAVDTGIKTTYSTLKLTVSVLGAYVTQRLTFASTAPANKEVYILVESTTSSLITASVLASLDLTTYRAGVSNSDTRSASTGLLSLSLLSGSATKYVLVLRPTKSYDAVELKLKAGIASALTSMRVYSAWFTTVTLPVELVSFDGYSDAGINTLRWSTASEINNAGFDIERSVDGVNYTTVATVAGAGTTNARQDYSYRDLSPLPLTYYRLTQRDYDGHTEQSEVISVTADVPATPQAVVRTNPFADHISATYICHESATMELTLYDMSGRQIATIATAIPTGENEVSLPGLSALPAGHYILRMTTATATHQVHVVKM